MVMYLPDLLTLLEAYVCVFSFLVKIIVGLSRGFHLLEDKGGTTECSSCCCWFASSDLVPGLSAWLISAAWLGFPFLLATSVVTCPLRSVLTLGHFGETFWLVQSSWFFIISYSICTIKHRLTYAPQTEKEQSTPALITLLWKSKTKNCT